MLISEHAAFAAGALVAGALLGGPASFYRALPFAGIVHAPQGLARFIERKLNRARRTARTRRRRGLIALLGLYATALMLGVAALWLARELAYGALLELWLLMLLLPIRPVFDRAQAMAQALQKDDPDFARDELEGTVWRNRALLDAHALARASVEYAAVGFALRLAAPVAWYVLLGLPGLFLSRTALLLHEQWGMQEEGFGHAAAQGQALMNGPPARIGYALAAVVSLFLPFTRPARALKALPLALLDAGASQGMVRVAASALGVSLGGPLSPYAKPWLGTGSARLAARDALRGLWLYGFCCLALLLSLGLLTY